MISLHDRIMLLQRSGIRRFTSLAKTVPDCVMLTLGEPEFDTPLPIRQAAEAALAAGQTHYAPNQGTEDLRTAIAQWETGRGFPLTAEQVLVTVGATGALFTALFGILNPGDEVIVPTPAFPLYESIITMAGGVTVPLHTKQDGFQITDTALQAVLSPKTKAIILNSPNNPTGAVYSAASLAAVKKGVLGKGIFVICDNVYQQLSSEDCPDLCRDDALRQQILLCQSFSKPYAMTGWRLGYLAGPEEVIARLMLLHAAQVASVPTFIQSAGVAALETDISPMAGSYETRRSFVSRRLREMGLDFPEPKGAFYIFPEISQFDLSDEDLCTRMILEAGVAAVPGSCFGCPGHIRLSFCCSDSLLAEGLSRMERFLRQL